jgi:hypothetical protein
MYRIFKEIRIAMFYKLSFKYLKSVGPCIVIYFCSKTNQMHNTSNLFYFGTILYMFRTFFPSIIRSLKLYIQHLLASGNEMERSSISFPLPSSHRTCMTCVMLYMGWSNIFRTGAAILFRIPPEAWMSVVSVVCWQVEVSAPSWSLVQRSPTECVCVCVSCVI